jgi:hypothetical protein
MRSRIIEGKTGFIGMPSGVRSPTEGRTTNHRFDIAHDEPLLLAQSFGNLASRERP